jgi:GH15 family glucan-1,4-alpha-glucosidase
MNGRGAEARALFERLLGLANDLGLYAEEYDVPRQRLVGNFPQAFTHLTLVAAAKALADTAKTSASAVAGKGARGTALAGGRRTGTR